MKDRLFRILVTEKSTDWVSNKPRKVGRQEATMPNEISIMFQKREVDIKTRNGQTERIVFRGSHTVLMKRNIKSDLPCPDTYISRIRDAIVALDLLVKD